MEVMLYSLLGGLALAAILGLLRVRHVVHDMNLQLNRAKADYGSSGGGPEKMRAFSRDVDNAFLKLRRIDGVLLALSMKPFGQGPAQVCLERTHQGSAVDGVRFGGTHLAFCST